MKTDAKLIEKRQELKDEITAGINKTPMAGLLNMVGMFIQKITRYPKQLPLLYCGFILSLLILLATLTLFTYPINNWTVVFGLVIFGQIGVLALIITYFNVNRVLANIRTSIVDYLVSEQSLSNLQEWLSFGWTKKIVRPLLIIYGVGSGAIPLYYFSKVSGEFSKIGVTLFTLCFVVLASVMFYYVPIMLILPLRLKACQFTLFENDPTRSDVIDSMATLLNHYTYGYVFNNVILQLGLAIIKVPILVSIIYMIVIGWLPVTVQFVLNQTSIRNIVLSSKKKTLNRIQAQIKEIHNGDITNKDNIEAINRLMDYHERIRKTPNSSLNLESVLRFLNQLILPLIAFLLGNLDTVIKFFAKP